MNNIDSLTGFLDRFGGLHAAIYCLQMLRLAAIP
jgi:hypothetical protein